MNIDLIKSTGHSCTSQYVENLLINNFVPTMLMPTRITQVSATLIDHIYYYEGDIRSSNITVKSGNFLIDISDHLANFTLFMKPAKKLLQTRPKVRIFSKSNLCKFQNMLQVADWNHIYNQNDVNMVYNNFHTIITTAF